MNWQEYLLNQFDPDNYPEVLVEDRKHPNLKRFCTYEELVIDTMARNGAIASSTLSLLFKPKVVVEFGVDLGWTSLLLSKLNPQAEVHGVDIRKETRFDKLYPTGYVCFLHELENYSHHIQKSEDFLMTNQVDFCFIDGDHEYPGVFADCWAAWHNRNRDGDWIIAFDDYHPDNAGVVKAVDELVKATGYKLHKAWSWVYIGTKHMSEEELCLITA